MKVKLIVVIILAGILGIGLIRTASKVRTGHQSEPSKNRIQWHVQQAKNQNRKQVDLPPSHIEYLGSDESEDIDQALAEYTVVIAQPVDSRSYEHSGEHLITWTKFRTVEPLSETRPPRCFDCNSLIAPAEMLPLLVGEFLVPQRGGSLVKEGIQVTEKQENFPFFDRSKSYLMLISLYPTGIALTAGGPPGVFVIDSAENLVPLNDEPHRLKKGLRNSFQNSLSKIRRKVMSH